MTGLEQLYGLERLTEIPYVTSRITAEGTTVSMIWKPYVITKNARVHGKIVRLTYIFEYTSSEQLGYFRCLSGGCLL